MEDKRATAAFAALVAFSLAGSAYCRFSGLDPTPIARPIGVLTLAAGCWAAFAPLVRAQGARAVAALGLVAAIGAAAELVGLATGFPFGRYAYSNRWWPVVELPNVGHYPLQLPFAWLLVAGSAYLSVAGSRWAVPAAAAIATLVDAMMEPTMTGHLRYWVWLVRGPLPGGAPVLNLLGWLVVSALAAAAMRTVLGDCVRSNRPAAVTLGLYAALVVGLGLL